MTDKGFGELNTEAENLLEFCLLPWCALTEEDITKQHILAASRVLSLLVETKRYGISEQFLNSLPSRILDIFSKNEDFRRRLIQLRCHQERHEEVCDLIQGGYFSDGSDLIEVWDKCQYALSGIPHPTSLQRFRIRKRNPPPKSISTGVRKTRTLDQSATAIFEEWFESNRHAPYPTPAQREEFAQRTGLSQKQIKSWFANARRRKLILESKRSKRRKRKAERPETEQVYQGPAHKPLPVETTPPPECVTPGTAATEPSPLQALARMCQRLPESPGTCVHQRFHQGVQSNGQRTRSCTVASSSRCTSLAALLAAPADEEPVCKQRQARSNNSQKRSTHSSDVKASTSMSQSSPVQDGTHGTLNPMKVQVLHPVTMPHTATTHTPLSSVASRDPLLPLDLSQSSQSGSEPSTDSQRGGLATAQAGTTRTYPSPVMLSAPWRSPPSAWHSPVFSPLIQAQDDECEAHLEPTFFMPPFAARHETFPSLSSPSHGNTLAPFASPSQSTLFSPEMSTNTMSYPSAASRQQALTPLFHQAEGEAAETLLHLSKSHHGCTQPCASSQFLTPGVSLVISTHTAPGLSNEPER